MAEFLGGLEYRLDREVAEFVVKAAGLRWDHWASSKRRRRRMLIDEPAVAAYLEGKPGLKAATEILQQLMATGKITDEKDLRRNSFLLKRLVATMDIDDDECRRVLVQSFIEDIIDHLLDEGVLDGTVDDGVVVFHATRSFEGPPKLSLVPSGPS